MRSSRPTLVHISGSGGTIRHRYSSLPVQSDLLPHGRQTDTEDRYEDQPYLGRWTMWNNTRTAAAMVAALLYTLGLMQNGGNVMSRLGRSTAPGITVDGHPL